ncbi:ester cyclase [Streptomyces sp. NPDC001595]|uniref:ester cyclase n=1 Tax=Streptomyces sp. NPDC001532 TaxID=3154520 RepID=UPI0033322381
MANSAPHRATPEPTELCRRFVKALNEADDAGIREVMAADFEDHHPGFEVHGVEDYLRALHGVREALDVRVEVEDLFAAGDRVVMRSVLTGRHLGPALGQPPTGRDLTWTTTEIWRVADGMLVERWAEDDLLGLRGQLSSAEANIALITELNDVVNERRYDDMDALFAEEFTDNNPAWSVRNVAELKELLAAAHEALDFTSHHDLIYAADPDKVVIHITFSGRHVKPFFGQQPTGREIRWTSIEVYRIERGRIAERWVQADTTGLMRQTGVELP